MLLAHSKLQFSMLIIVNVLMAFTLLEVDVVPAVHLSQLHVLAVLLPLCVFHAKPISLSFRDNAFASTNTISLPLRHVTPARLAVCDAHQLQFARSAMQSVTSQ